MEQPQLATGNPAVRLGTEALLVLEEIFIHFLQIQRLINSDTDVVPDHQRGESLSINKYDLERVTFCKLVPAA